MSPSPLIQVCHVALGHQTDINLASLDHSTHLYPVKSAILILSRLPYRNRTREEAARENSTECPATALLRRSPDPVEP